jgi:hypothetical protein
MTPARLASLILTGGLLFLSGCSACDFMHLGRSRNCATGCCDYDDVAAMPGPMFGGGCSSGVCPGGPLISNSIPHGIEGPTLFPPMPSPVPPQGGPYPGAPFPGAPFPGTVMPPAAATPRPGPLPSIVTIPQATAVPSPP